MFSVTQTLPTSLVCFFITYLRINSYGDLRNLNEYSLDHPHQYATDQKGRQDWGRGGG